MAARSKGACAVSRCRVCNLGCIPMTIGATSFTSFYGGCGIMRSKTILSKKCDRGGLRCCGNLITSMGTRAGNLGCIRGGNSNFAFATEGSSKATSNVGSRTLGATARVGPDMGTTDKDCNRFLHISLGKGCNSLNTGVRTMH